ncbi:Neurobeachin-like protein 2 [Frankliniella fusca]|uniref:Neurobeachin-like protein 2 n=1 Tax=Frankliniella fusca TaxID=407009 RepID=A0AAE1HSY2_9NEOP|nr:Neurobeachin-like protein 2 [Frankliniella fusca]
MRLKLCPNLSFNPHTDASNLRDNTGWLSRRRSSETPLSLTSWSAAVRTELDDDALPEEDLRSLLAEPEPAEESTREEKLVLSQECELVTLMTSVRGRLELTTTHASFCDLSPLQDDVERHDFKWPLSRLREVHLRRYNLRRSALEFFLMDQTNYFVNFTPKTRNKVYSRILGLRPPNLILSSSRSPAEMLRASGLTQKWVNREISNFDYLMQLNTIAGRSYNDLSQYPVFPWIIADYTSKHLDLENPSTFRDLSKPIGVVNPKNVAEVKAKYDNFEDPSGVIAKFHYGTHYSNSAGVLHYLVRVEPFTSLHVELQSGRFDVADRQFHSIPQTWKLLMDNPNDVKELTPEFFYFPEFLKNLNGFDLGLLQGTKERVTDVALPPWASSPEDFIFKHRRALECEYVSAHLHEWIDLIFGYKQKGPKAVEALNVFYYCSYEGAVDLDALKSAVEREAMEGMINNFGQTPCQLLREPHPQRLSLAEAASRQLRPDLTQHLDKIRPFTIMELTSDRDAVAFVSPPRSPPRSFLAAALPDVVVTVTRSGVVGVHQWLPADRDRHAPRGFSFEVDPSTSNPKCVGIAVPVSRCTPLSFFPSDVDAALTSSFRLRKKLPAPPHPAVPASSHLFCVSHDGKVLLSGGHWDCSLRGWSISRAKPLFSVVRHFDLVTCVALDRCGWFLVTGSRDTTCVVWDLAGGSNSPDGGHGGSGLAGGGLGALGVVTGGAAGGPGGGASNPAAPKPVQTLYGHDAAVTCVAIMTELDMVVSGSSDGTVNVHTIREGQYLRTLYPVGCVDPRAEVGYLALSHLGHIAFTANDKASNSIHVYSVNGAHLGSKYVSGRVTGLVTVAENVVVVDDAGDLTISRLYGLRPIYDVPLHVPVQTIIATANNTHLLVPLRDGNLVVIGVPPHGTS